MHFADLPARDRSFQKDIPVTSLARTKLDLAAMLSSSQLARIIERALPGQILVGDFRTEMPADGQQPGTLTVDSVDFVDMATRTVGQLAGIELSGERVDAIRCYLTGPRLTNGEFTVRRIVISDKHGISRRVYNAKVNIYRQNAEPILLGIEDRALDTDPLPADGTEPLLRPAHA